MRVTTYVFIFCDPSLELSHQEGHNICFCLEIRKNIFELSSILPLSGALGPCYPILSGALNLYMCIQNQSFLKLLSQSLIYLQKSSEILAL